MFEVASSKFSGIQQLTKLHTDYMYVLPVPHAAGAHARARNVARPAGHPSQGAMCLTVRLPHSCGNLQVLLLPPPYLRCDGHYEEPLQASGRRRQGGVCGGLDSLCWVLFFAHGSLRHDRRSQAFAMRDTSSVRGFPSASMLT